jgi:hypothetical protein
MDMIIAATLMVVAAIEMRMIKVENAFSFLAIRRFAMNNGRFNWLGSAVKVQFIVQTGQALYLSFKMPWRIN